MGEYFVTQNKSMLWLGTKSVLHFCFVVIFHLHDQGWTNNQISSLLAVGVKRGI